MSFRTRNCFHCGADFDSYAGARICPDCRALGKLEKAPLDPKLTFRETQLVRLVSQGKLNKEIAYELHLTEGTVKEYMNRIFRKTGAHNRVALAILFLENGPKT